MDIYISLHAICETGTWLSFIIFVFCISQILKKDFHNQFIHSFDIASLTKLLIIFQCSHCLWSCLGKYENQMM